MADQNNILEEHFPAIRAALERLAEGELTKREKFAKAALGVLIADRGYDFVRERYPDQDPDRALALMAYSIADAMIAQGGAG